LEEGGRGKAKKASEGRSIGLKITRGTYITNRNGGKQPRIQKENGEITSVERGKRRKKEEKRGARN